MNIILFDGECHVCDRSVQFIFKKDPKANFYFASLQGEKGRALLKEHHLPLTINSIVLIKNGTVYLKSAAVLQICKHLKGVWKLFYLFILVPAFIRDKVYDWFANHRYIWFGQKQECLLPDEKMKNRFLDI